MFILINLISIISNFYFWYKLSALTAIYFVCIYFFDSNNNKSIKDFFYKIYKIALSYFVSILLSSIIFIPTIYTFLSSSRISSSIINNYGLEYYEKFILGLSIFRISNWTIVTSSTLFIVLLPIFIKNFKKEKPIFIFLIAIIIMMLIPIFGSIMNGFSYPTNRFCFAFCFCSAYFICRYLDIKTNFSFKELLLIVLSVIIYFIVLLKMNLMRSEVIFAFIPSILFIVLIFIKKYFRIFSSYFYSFFIVIVVYLSCIFNGFIMFNSIESKMYIDEFISNKNLLKKYSTINNRFKNIKPALSYIKSIDSGFYRISFDNNSISNISLLYDFKPLASYLSLVNGSVYDLSMDISNIELSASSPTREFNNRTRITSLLSTKYYISKSEDSVPIGYTLLKKINNCSIYINNDFLQPIAVYSKKISSKTYSNLTSYEKEQTLYKAVYSDEIDLEEYNPSFNNKYINYSIDQSSKANILNNKIKVTREKSSIKLKLDKTNLNDNEVYLIIKGLKFTPEVKEEKYSIKFSYGKKIYTKKFLYDDNRYYIDSDELLINLGKYSTDKELSITFNDKGTYTYDSIEIISINFDDYIADINNLNSGVSNVKYTYNTVTSSIDLKQDSFIQLNTGYSKGWKVFIDGKEKKVYKSNVAFIGTKVKKGKHKVVFVYETPYKTSSIIASIMGLLLFGTVVCIEKKKIS